MKKICFITTSRADFGMVNELVKESLRYKRVKTYLVISGNHNEQIYGRSIKEINLNKKVLTQKIFVKQRNKNNLSVSLSFSKYLKKYSLFLEKLKPDVFVVFGDRYEMLAAALSAYILNIPIAHIAGGEKTSGSLDEGYRHSITKLSNLHFPTSKIYRNRLIQLGENPKTVFNFGSLNRQKILNTKYLTKKEISKKYKIKFLKKNLLLTYHPENIGSDMNVKNLSLVLDCLKTLKDTCIIITSPNADAEGVKMIKFIRSFITKIKKKNIYFFESLGTQVYLSILKIIDGVLGNSSSGISEAPIFSINSINLGNRQMGREMPSSVINCKTNRKIILRNLKNLKKKKRKILINRDKDVSKKILKTIISFKKFNLKNFYDIH